MNDVSAAMSLLYRDLTIGWLTPVLANEDTPCDLQRCFSLLLTSEDDVVYWSVL